MRWIVILASLWAATAAADDFALQDARRVLFLGDSNTHAGHYIADLDAFLAAKFPDRDYELINLGLPSETACGLSEPGHPFPRPNIHERLDRALKVIKPEIVVLCYGMNDGIYAPFDEARFARFRDGMTTLLDACRRSGAKVYIVTPPPFDPEPVRAQVLPAGREGYGWVHPFEGYDEVLTRYSRWLESLDGDAVRVVDAHGAIAKHLAEARRRDPKYRLSGDGVHINAEGHRLIAEAILRAWMAPSLADDLEIDAPTAKVVRGEVSDLVVDQDHAAIRFRWALHVPGELARGRRLRVTGLAPGSYRLKVGDREFPQSFRSDGLGGDGLLLDQDLAGLAARGAILHKLIEERRRLLDPAWLDAVGHVRPGMTRGLPLDEAKRKVLPLDESIRRETQPATVEVRLVRHPR